MILRSSRALAQCRSRRRCEVCGKGGRQAACHIFTVGSGRVDAPWNLVAMGLDPFRDCDCHHRHHEGKRPTRADLLAIAARREKTTADAITEAVGYIRALSKEGHEARPMTLSAEARRLVRIAGIQTGV